MSNWHVFLLLSSRKVGIAIRTDSDPTSVHISSASLGLALKLQVRDASSPSSFWRKGNPHCEFGLGPSSLVWQTKFFRVPQPAT